MKMQRYVLIGLCLLFPFPSTASIGPKIKSGLNKVLPNSVKKGIPGLTTEEKMADLMQEQVDTSKNAFEQMQKVAKDMLALRRKVEQANSIKNDGKSFFKDLADAKYGKVALDISEKIGGISLNPSDYIPNLACTREMRRDCSFSYFREKSLLGRIDSFTNRNSNFLSANPPRSLNAHIYKKSYVAQIKLKLR